MSTTTLQFLHRVDGVLTDVTSVVLSNAAGTAGVVRTDTGAAVVADGEAMTRQAAGTYTYAFADPASGLTYSWWAEVVYNGVTSRYEFTSTGGTAGSGLYTDADLNWVLSRLPSGATFSRNGVTYADDPRDAAIEQLEHYGADEDKAEHKRLYAIIALYEILLSDGYESERLGDYSYNKPVWQSRLADYREQLAQATVGGISFVPVTTSCPGYVWDENAR